VTSSSQYLMTWTQFMDSICQHQIFLELVGPFGAVRSVFRVMNPLLWIWVDQRSEETHQSLGALVYLGQ
jgi:hypothetical protein